MREVTVIGASELDREKPRGQDAYGWMSHRSCAANLEMLLGRMLEKSEPAQGHIGIAAAGHRSKEHKRVCKEKMRSAL